MLAITLKPVNKFSTEMIMIIETIFSSFPFKAGIGLSFKKIKLAFYAKCFRFTL
jgi:hypothetical protein